MYRVLITDEMIKDSETYSQEMEDEGIDENLKSVKLNPVNDKLNLEPYQNYLNAIADNYKYILQLLPSQFDNEQNSFAQYAVNLNEKFYNRNGNETFFYDIVISYMRYSKLARKKMLPYLEKYGFNTCVYCNAAEGDIDHFYDKATYPFLCTSFFNLVPCCSSCNGKGKKANRHICFSPYIENTQIPKVEKNPFEFVFDIKNIGGVCKNKNDIKFVFIEKEWMGDKCLYGQATMLKSYKDIFKIEACYEKKRNYIKDVLNDRRFQDYWQNKTASAVSEDRLKPEPDEENKINILRVESLNYEDVHKRELMKFLLDLGKYIGFIPK